MSAERKESFALGGHAARIFAEPRLWLRSGRTLARVTPAEHAANYQAMREQLGKEDRTKPAAKKAAPKKAAAKEAAPKKAAARK